MMTPAVSTFPPALIDVALVVDAEARAADVERAVLLPVLGICWSRCGSSTCSRGRRSAMDASLLRTS